MKKNETFHSWMKKQRDRKDLIGHLAYDMTETDTWDTVKKPRGRAARQKEKWIEYFTLWLDVDNAILDIFEAAWLEYTLSCLNCGKACDGSLYVVNGNGGRKNVCCIECARAMLDIDDDLKLGYTLKKHDCPNCGEVNEIVILEKNPYKWKDDQTGYQRTLAGNETVEIKCANCGEILI